MRPCPLCASDRPRSLFIKNSCDVAFCDACGFGYVASLPEPAQLQALYDDSYFHGDPTKFGYFDYALEKSNRTLAFASKKRFMEHMFPSGGRLLDVGCADGSFLEMFSLPWAVEGVELSKDIAGKIPESLRKNVYQGFFEHFGGSPSGYDVITMWDVLDHVQDPLATLRKAYGLLKPGGILGLVTGDMKSVLARLMGKHWYLYIPPVHLSYFSSQAIKSALDRSGFSTLSIQYEGKRVSIPLVFYRLAHLRSSARWQSSFKAMANKVPSSWNIKINFFDVMQVWARKPVLV